MSVAVVIQLRIIRSAYTAQSWVISSNINGLAYVAYREYLATAHCVQWKIKNKREKEKKEKERKKKKKFKYVSFYFNLEGA